MVYEIVAIGGLIFTITGTFLLSVGKKINRAKIYPFLLFGGLLILFYSIHIRERVFIILKSAYSGIIIYDMIKLKISKRRLKRK